MGVVALSSGIDVGPPSAAIVDEDVGTAKSRSVNDKGPESIGKEGGTNVDSSSRGLEEEEKEDIGGGRS